MPILFNYSLSATYIPGLGKKQKQQAWRDVTITESSGRKWRKIWRTRTCCIFQKQRVFIRKVLIDESYKDDVLWHLSTFSATVLWFPANVDHYILTFYRVAEGEILYIYTSTHLHTHTHTHTQTHTISQYFVKVLFDINFLRIWWNEKYLCWKYSI